ncbi:hypothetical protein GLT81_00660, partial [Nanohaloarchaea archaeon]|nr:hypothetical protein [Candidatus Nanohaloarchaea archaeon]
ADQFVFGNGSINLTANQEFITKAKDSVATKGKREIFIQTYDPFKYLKPTGINEITARILVPGRQDSSGVNVSFNYADQVQYALTNKTGYAKFEWNTSNFQDGAYNTFVNITESESNDLYVPTDPRSKSKRLIIPSELNISAFWRDNNVAETGSKNFADEDGDNYPNLPNKVVYRNPGPYGEPTKLYLAANVSIPFGQRDSSLSINNATVNWWINGTSDNGTEIVENIARKNVNLSEFQSGLADNRNQWWDGFVTTNTTWEPRSNFPVGAYNLTINATHPAPGFESIQRVIPLEVRGVLNASIVSPESDSDFYQFENITLKGKVQNMNGKTFSNSSLDQVRWGIDEDGGPNNPDDSSLSGGGEYINLGSTRNGGRYNLNSWIIIQDFDDNWDGRESLVLDVGKEFYEITRTERRDEFRDFSSFQQEDRENQLGSLNSRDEGYREDIPHIRYNTFIRVAADGIRQPNQDTVATGSGDGLNVSANFKEFNTNDGIGNRIDFLVYNATCVQCEDERNKNLTQRANEKIDEDVAKFNFNFSNEQYGRNYTIKIFAASGGFDEEPAPSPFNTVKKNFTVARSLGTGTGDINLNGECEPDSEGENVLTAPNDCGFENLPEEYWVNQSALPSVNGTDENPVTNTTNYNHFRNESHPEYEPGANYYAAHPAYSDEYAGGCNFDGDKDRTYEEPEICPDFFNQVPVIKNLSVISQDASPPYVKESPNSTEVKFRVYVKDENSNLGKVWLISPTSNGIVTFFDKDGKECKEFCKLTAKAQVSTSGSKSFTAKANDTSAQPPQETNDNLVVEADTDIVSIDSASLPQGPFADGDEVTAEISLSGATNVPEGIDFDVSVGGTETGAEKVSNGWNATFTAAAEDQKVDINVTEQSGYSDNVTLSYNVDNDPPNVTGLLLETVKSPPIQAEENINISANVVDATGVEISTVKQETSIQTKQVCSNSSFSETGSGLNKCKITAPDVSENVTYRVEAEDVLGNVNDTQTAEIEVDSNAPTINNFKAEPDIVSPGSDVTLSVNKVEDSENNLAEFNISTNNSVAGCSEGDLNAGTSDQCRITVDNPTEFTFNASDEAGNFETSTVTVEIDSQKPFVNIKNPSSGSIVSGDIQVEANITDRNLNSSTTKYNIVGETTTDTSNGDLTSGGSGSTLKATVDTTKLADGNYTISANASDIAGNENSTSVSNIQVDNTAPKINILEPSGGETIGGSFEFVVEINDSLNNGQESSYDYNISNTTGGQKTGVLSSSNGGNFTVTVDTSTLLADGDYTFGVTAEDSLGNRRSKSIGFTADNLAPSVDILTPDPYRLFRDGKILNPVAEIKDKANDLNTSSIKCRISGGFVDASNTAQDQYECNNVNVGSSGLQNITVKAKDNIGQTGKDTLFIEVDDLAPSIIDTSFNKTLIQSSTPVLFSAEVLDENVDAVTLSNITDSKDGEVRQEWSFNDDFRSDISGSNYDNSGWSNGDSRITSGSSGRSSINRTTVNINETHKSKVTAELTPKGDNEFGFILPDGSRVKFSKTSAFTGVRLVDENGALVQQNGEFSYGTNQKAEYELIILNNRLSVFEGTTQILSGNISDTYSDSVGLFAVDNRVQVDSFKAANDARQFERVINPENENMTLSVEDLVGRQALENVSLEIDDSPPRFDNLSIDKEFIKEGEKINFSAAVIDENRNTSKVNITVVNSSTDNIQKDLAETCINRESSLLCYANWTGGSVNESEFQFKIRARDNAGNKNSTVHQNKFKVDTVDPEFTNIALDDFSEDYRVPENYRLGTRNELFNNRFGIGYLSRRDRWNIELDVEDFTPPTSSIDDENLKLVNLSGGQNITGTSIGAFGNIVENKNEGEKGEIKINAGEIINNFSYAEGNYTLEMRIKDKAGNTQKGINRSSWIYIDFTKPEINEVELNDSIVGPNQEINVSINISDGESGVAVANAKYDQNYPKQNFSKLNSSYWSTDIAAQAFSQKINISVYDKSGNRRSKVEEYIFDDSPPKLKDLDATDKDGDAVITSGETVNLTAFVNETHYRNDTADFEILYGENDTLAYDVDGEICATQNESYELCHATWNGKDDSGNNLASTNYTFRITATDKADNTNESVFSGLIELDNNDPSINDLQIRSDLGNRFFANESETVTLTGNVLDQTPNRDNTSLDIINHSTGSLEYSLNDSIGFDQLNGGFKFSREWNINSSIDNGNYTFNISTLDQAENPQKKTAENTFIFVDTIDPTISKVSINDSIVNSNELIDINVSTPGDNSTTLQNLTADGQKLNYQENIQKWNGTINEADDKDQTIQTFAKDRAGNTNTNNTINYTVDTDSPDISGASNNDTYIQTGVITKFTVNISDRHVNVTEPRESKVNFSIYSITNGEVIEEVPESCVPFNNTLVTCRANYSGTSISGEYENVSVKANVRDEARNTISQPVNRNWVVVDNKQPNITEDYNRNDSFVNGSDVVEVWAKIKERSFSESLVNLTINDPQDGFEADIDDDKCQAVPGAANSYNCTGTWDNIPDNEGKNGNYTLNISASDLAGNKNQENPESVSIKLDNTPPDISRVSINDTIVSSNELIDV